MKTLQDLLFSEFPFPTKATSSFDPYAGFQLLIGREFEWRDYITHTGINISYTSTGGRIGYSDYSGIVRGDQLLSLISFGIMGGIEKSTLNNNWTFGFRLPFNYDITNFTLSQELILGGQLVDSEKYEFVSRGLSIQPNFNIFRNFASFGAGITLGYFIPVLNPELTLKENESVIIDLADQNQHAKAQWSGLRAGIVLRYRFVI